MEISVSIWNQKNFFCVLTFQSLSFFYTLAAIHPSIHPSTHPPIHPSTHPPIHPSTHLAPSWLRRSKVSLKNKALNFFLVEKAADANDAWTSLGWLGWLGGWKNTAPESQSRGEPKERTQRSKDREQIFFDNVILLFWPGAYDCMSDMVLI